MYVHNYLCYAREAKKAQWVVFFDVSQSQLGATLPKDGADPSALDQSFSTNNETNSPLELFRCRMLNLE